MRPPPQLIEINYASSDENSLVECVLFEKINQCCCDSGAHKCIMSYDTFQCLNISNKKLDKRQMYNIKTAVGTDFNAILGAITVPMTFYNVKEKTELKIEHPFLVLREGKVLDFPLIGTDFMKKFNGVLEFTQDAPVKLYLNGILVGPRPQTIPIRYISLDDKFSAPNAPKTYDHGSVNPNFFEPDREDEECLK